VCLLGHIQFTSIHKRDWPNWSKPKGDPAGEDFFPSRAVTTHFPEKVEGKLTMAKTAKKMSARERKERQEMRRWLLIGGGVFGLAAAAGVGVTFMDPSFPTLDGEGRIDDRLGVAGLSDHVLRLTEGKDGADVLIIGTTDCSFCREFVEDGLDDVVTFAKEQGLGLTYASIGSSSSALTSTQLVGGFAKHSDAQPTKILQAVYEAASAISLGRDVEATAVKYGKPLGVFPNEVKEILNEGALEITKRIQATQAAFPITGTPAFFVASEQAPGRIHTFSGWAGKAGLRRQIEAARTVKQ
jgi:hypothetical protein